MVACDSGSHRSGDADRQGLRHRRPELIPSPEDFADLCSSLSLEMPIRAMEIYPLYRNLRYEWTAFRSNGALIFIDCCYFSSCFTFNQLSGENYEKDGGLQMRRILSLLKALCRMGLFLVPHMSNHFLQTEAFCRSICARDTRNRNDEQKLSFGFHKHVQTRGSEDIHRQQNILHL